MASQAPETNNKKTPVIETPEAEIARRTENIRNGHEKLRYSEVADKGSEGHVVRAVQTDMVAALEKSRSALSPEAAARLDSFVKDSQKDGKFYADGAYGPKTKDLVKLFQEVNNLKVDGIFGKQSLAALDASKTQAPIATSSVEIIAPSEPVVTTQNAAITAPPQNPINERFQAVTASLGVTAEQLNPENITSAVLSFESAGMTGTPTIDGQPAKLSLVGSTTEVPKAFGEYVLNVISGTPGTIPTLQALKLPTPTNE